MRKFYNKLLLYLGFTLVNRQGNTVKLSASGKQIIKGTRRVRPYSMDDKYWRIKW